MTKTEPEQFLSYCGSCCKQTKHTVKADYTFTYDSDYINGSSEYMVISCNGCEQCSFLAKHHDYDNAYEDENGDWVADTSTESFPKYIDGHALLKDIYDAPEIVREIYAEAISALKEGALTLAGLGLRATIEAVCNDRSIKGGNLSIRINNLAKEGFISKKDASRLHAIRFLGNDAAHEIKKPNMSSLKIAIRIVEHLITTIYILDEEANGILETPIENISSFVELLNKKLEKYNIGEEHSLVNMLGKASRRFIDNFTTMEQQLIAEISAGTYASLELASKQKIQGSNKEVQLYRVK